MARLYDKSSRLPILHSPLERHLLGHNAKRVAILHSCKLSPAAHRNTDCSLDLRGLPTLVDIVALLGKGRRANNVSAIIGRELSAF